MRVPVYFIRAVGYIIAITVAVAYFMADLPAALPHSLFLQFMPVWLSCGWVLVYYKKKTFPFSRAENIFSTVASITVIALLVLRVAFVLLAK